MVQISIRANVERLLRKGNGRGMVGMMIHFPLYFLSLLYMALIKIRLLLYKSSLLPSYKLPFKVVSIGNISTGGTGKTPMTLYLGKMMKEMGYKVTIISRGYKGRKEKDVTILSDGETLFYGHEECGDEPYLIASKLKGVPVITGKDRCLSGRLAFEKFNIDLAILDDGFQHLRLARDLDILLVTPNMFNEKNYLLPRGYLREPLKAIERANLIMIKDGEGKYNADLKKPIFNFKYRSNSLIEIREGKKEDVKLIKGKKILALCGIASPDAFFATLDGLGLLISERLIYHDHYHYTSRDIRNIEEISKRVDLIITTEKDGVKLKNLVPEGLDIYALEIEVEVSEEERFKSLLKNML